MNIYNGGASGISPQIGNLNSFRIRVSDGSGFYRFITDFHNLESTFVESGIMAGFPLSISHNNEWITATNNLFADGQSMHSITFSTSSELSQIEILTNADSSVGTGYFSIDEIETFGVAVPEPSAYALLLGASLLLLRIIRKKKERSFKE